MSTPTYGGRVVAGYDGSDESGVGLDWAIRAAAATGAPLRVVVVADEPDRALGDAGLFHAGAVDDVADLAEKHLSGAHLDDGRVETRVGRAGPTLIQYASGNDLIVVGSRGHGAVAGAVIGSVSHHLVRHAPCPVVVARPVDVPAARQISVGLDGSTESQLALGWAVRHAKAVGGEVVALHGFRPGSTGGPFGSEMGEEFTRRLDQAERRLRGWVDGAPLLHTSGIKTEAVAVPARKLLTDVSRHSALVVVGARGHDGVAGLLLGSVADHVVAHAHCPVVVVR